MDIFEREAPNVRLAETRRGDTLRRIALRELGTAEQWIELALVNALRPPYIVDEELDRADGVLVAGDAIKIPAASSSVSADANPDEVFGRDVLLLRGQLQIDAGDLAVHGGLDNFLQALRNRLTVKKRELGYHPTYGNFADWLRGRGNGPAITNLAAFYMKSALLEEPRVAEVSRCIVTVDGDVLRIDADVVPVAGRVINFTTGL